MRTLGSSIGYTQTPASAHLSDDACRVHANVLSALMQVKKYKMLTVNPAWGQGKQISLKGLSEIEKRLILIKEKVDDARDKHLAMRARGALCALLL